MNMVCDIFVFLRGDLRPRPDYYANLPFEREAAKARRFSTLRYATRNTYEF
jgi:hypothetical protein